MPLSRSLVLPAVLDSLAKVLDLAGEAAANARLSQRRTDHVTLAVEEAFVNVCRYAYEEGGGVVEVRICTGDGEVVVEIADRGVPFDPLGTSSPDPAAPLAERRAGGMGILLLRKVTDRLCYRREDGRNVLEILVREGAEPE